MEWIDPIKRGKEVSKRVLKGNKRMVYKTRPNTRYYGGIYTFDIAGCNFDCAYCWTSLDTKLGCGKMIDKLNKKKNLYKSPIELWDIYDKGSSSPKIRLSGGEPLITPDFILEFLDIGAHYYKQRNIKNGQIWLETNGFELTQNPKLAEEMGKYRDYLRIYLSIKQTPEKFAETTGVEQKHHDAGFKALELLVKNRVLTVCAGPLANIFDPKTIPYFVERLQKIHKNAPLIVEIGDIVFMPAERIVKRLNEREFTKDKRFKTKEVRKTYVDHLKKLGLEYRRVDTDCRTDKDITDYIRSLI